MNRVTWKVPDHKTALYTDGEGGTMFRGGSVFALIIALVSCSSESTPVGLCSGWTCSNHGTCEIVDDEATCDCETGYVAQGDECVLPVCEGYDCGHGQCVVVGTDRDCQCDQGYTGLRCDRCATGYEQDPDSSSFQCVLIDQTCTDTDVCTGLGCVHGLCLCPVGDTEYCLCDEGYAGDQCEVCDSPTYHSVDSECIPCNHIEFIYSDGSASTVLLTGSWLTDNGTFPETVEQGAIQLTNNGDGTFSMVTKIEPEGRYEYQFIVDSTTWVPDPDTRYDRVENSRGSMNSVREVCSF